MTDDIKQVMSDFRRARLTEVKALLRLKKAPTKENLQHWISSALESRKQEINAIEREFFPTLNSYQNRLKQIIRMKRKRRQGRE